MAANESAAYGEDIRAVFDGDELLSTTEGLEVVYQDALHRLMTDDILGDDGTGGFMISGWGFDCRKLLGINSSRLKSYQPILSEVLTRDPRIDSAEVVLTPVRTNGLEDVELRARCVTALGPFTLIKRITELTAADLVGQR